MQCLLMVLWWNTISYHTRPGGILYKYGVAQSGMGGILSQGKNWTVPFHEAKLNGKCYSPWTNKSFRSPVRMGVIVNVTWSKFHQSNDKDLYVSYIRKNIAGLRNLRPMGMGWSYFFSDSTSAFDNKLHVTVSIWRKCTTFEFTFKTSYKLYVLRLAYKSTVCRFRTHNMQGRIWAI